MPIKHPPADSGMKVLIPVGIFPPDIGGPANFVPRFANWLVQQGHVVQVICWSDVLGHDDSHYPFKIHRIPRHAPRIKRSIQTLISLIRFSRDADLLFINGLPFEAQCAASLLRRPTVHKVVGDTAWEVARIRGWFTGSMDDFQSAAKSLPASLLCLKRTVPLIFAAKIVTPSRYLQQIVKGWGIGSREVSVILNSTPRQVEGDAVHLVQFSGKTVSTVCRLVPWKGLDRLINLLVDLPDARLVIAGEGPELENLQALASEKLVEGRVIFLGQISKSQVRGLLQKSDVFVLNSSYEGLPHVVLEAMAAEVPVIATDVGGTGEAVLHEETGLLVPLGDDQALLAGLRLLLQSEETRSRLTANASRHLKSRFSEEACFSSFEAALQAVKVGRSQ